MSRFKRIYTFSLLLAMLAFTGCGADIALEARDDGSTGIDMSAGTGDRVESLVRALYGLAGAEAAESIVPPEDIRQALVSGGYEDVRVSASGKRTTASAVMPAGSRSRTVERTQDTLSVTVSPKALAAEYDALPEASRAYLDLLMAPVLTGEELSAEEYTDVMAAVYGNDLASELSDAAVTLTLRAPPGKKARALPSQYLADAGSGRSVTFQVPLTELLTLTDDVTLGIRWE